MKRTKRVYISGKIGEEVVSQATREKFAKAEEMLRKRGFDVFNPTISGLGTLAENRMKRFNFMSDEEEKLLGGKYRRVKWYDCILQLDLEALALCDAIYMLPDFLGSKGAKVEHAYAIAIGLEVIYDEELYLNGTLRR